MRSNQTGLNIIHCADLHLGASLPPDQKDPLLALRLILRASRQKRADLLLFAGDVLESDQIKPTELQALIALLNHYREIPMVAVTGNHDPLCPGSPWERVKRETRLVVCAGTEQLTWRRAGVRIWCTGFRTAVQAEPMLAGPGLSRKQKERAAGVRYWDIGLAHGDLGAARSPYNPLTLEHVKHSGLDYLALGHIHRPSPVPERVGGTFYAYSGSPLPFRLGDEGDRGVYEVKLSPGQVKASFLPLSPYAYHRVKVTLHGAGKGGQRTGGSCEEKLALEVLPELPGKRNDYYDLTLDLGHLPLDDGAVERIGILLVRQGVKLLQLKAVGGGLARPGQWVNLLADQERADRPALPDSLAQPLTEREQRFVESLSRVLKNRSVSALDREAAIACGLSYLRGILP